MVEAGEHIWVANPGEQNILVLDRSGAVMGTVGRAGQGPGEFQAVGGLAVDPAGRMAVYDLSALSIQLFDSEGIFHERIQVSPRVWDPKGFVATADGFVISGGVQGNEHAIHRIDRDGALVESWFPIPEPTDPALDWRTAAATPSMSPAGRSISRHRDPLDSEMRPESRCERRCPTPFRGTADVTERRHRHRA